MSAHTNRILAARLGVATMKLKHLVAELEGVRTWEKPKVALEQYPTSPEIAAHMLISAMEHGDVEDAAVADLGCGGGILGIGAAILGASHVLAVDIDPDALSVAAENVAEFEVPVDLICCDMSRLPTRHSARRRTPTASTWSSCERGSTWSRRWQHSWVGGLSVPAS
jgi:2-polyprenyl-3-methyl-5-hydroxy-6-metoxy-1,4-benzoquinol methylase